MKFKRFKHFIYLYYSNIECDNQVRYFKNKLTCMIGDFSIYKIQDSGGYIKYREINGIGIGSKPHYESSKIKAWFDMSRTYETFEEYLLSKHL